MKVASGKENFRQWACGSAKLIQPSFRRRLLRRLPKGTARRRSFRARNWSTKWCSRSMIRAVRLSMSARVGTSSRARTPRIRLPSSRSRPPRMLCAAFSSPPGFERRGRESFAGRRGFRSISAATSRSISSRRERSASSVCIVVRLLLPRRTVTGSRSLLAFVTAHAVGPASLRSTRNPVLLRLKLLGHTGIVPAQRRRGTRAVAGECSSVG